MGRSGHSRPNALILAPPMVRPDLLRIPLPGMMLGVSHPLTGILPSAFSQTLMPSPLNTGNHLAGNVQAMGQQSSSKPNLAKTAPQEASKPHERSDIPVRRSRSRWIPVRMDQWQKDASMKLRKLMEESNKSQRALNEWDREQGLPKSHTPTMVNTARSRKQLLEERILCKWDGTTLLEPRPPKRLRSSNSVL